MRTDPVSLSIGFRVVDPQGTPIPRAELDESTDRLSEILRSVSTDNFQDLDVDAVLGHGEVTFTAEVLAQTLDASVLVPELMTLVWKAIEQIGGVVDLGQEISRVPLRSLDGSALVTSAPEEVKPVWRLSAADLLPI